MQRQDTASGRMSLRTMGMEVLSGKASIVIATPSSSGFSQEIKDHDGKSCHRTDYNCINKCSCHRHKSLTDRLFLFLLQLLRSVHYQVRTRLRRFLLQHLSALLQTWIQLLLLGVLPVNADFTIEASAAGTAVIFVIMMITASPT